MLDCDRVRFATDLLTNISIVAMLSVIIKCGADAETCRQEVPTLKSPLKNNL